MAKSIKEKSTTLVQIVELLEWAKGDFSDNPEVYNKLDLIEKEVKNITIELLTNPPTLKKSRCL